MKKNISLYISLNPSFERKFNIRSGLIFEEILYKFLCNKFVIERNFISVFNNPMKIMIITFMNYKYIF